MTNQNQQPDPAIIEILQEIIGLKANMVQLGASVQQLGKSHGEVVGWINNEVEERKAQEAEPAPKKGRA